MKVGVIGHGFVGQAVSSFYKTTLVYDKFKDLMDLEEVAKKSDVIFICVPTDGTKSGYNYKPLNEVTGKLNKLKYNFPIIIKSTIQPGTTDYLQKKYPKLQLYFSPEFLDQATAVEDFRCPKNPPCVLLGVPENGKKIGKWAGQLFKDFNVELVISSAISAETFKLATNSFYATRVVFANQIYDYCQSKGADFDLFSKLWSQIGRLGTHGYKIFHNGGRGAGGYCIPKDLHALNISAKRIKKKLPLLEAVERVNNTLLAESGKLVKSNRKIN